MAAGVKIVKVKSGDDIKSAAISAAPVLVAMMGHPRSKWKFEWENQLQMLDVSASHVWLPEGIWFGWWFFYTNIYIYLYIYM